MEEKKSNAEEYYHRERAIYHKWSKIMKNQQKYLNANGYTKKKVKLLTRLGIPDQLRGYIWQLFAGVNTTKVPNQYSALLSEAINSNSDNRIDRNETDIIKDLTRTSHSTFFKEKLGLGQSCLYNVLSIFSRQSDIGYVQGMSILAACLLSYMDEESAYWMMLSLMENYKLKGFFQPEFPELNRAYYKLLNLIKAILPKIYRTLRKWKVYPNYYASQWFITLFLLTVKHEVFIRLFDIFLFEKEHKILYRISLAMLKINEDKIVAAKSFDDLMTLFNNLGRDISLQLLFEEVFNIKFSKKLLDEYERQYDLLKTNKGSDEFMEQLEN